MADFVESAGVDHGTAPPTATEGATNPLDFASDKLDSILSYAAFCTHGAPADYPLEVFLEVSNICDLKCAMGSQFSALNTNRMKQLLAQDRGFLDTGDVSAQLEGVLRGALLVHCFGFGEPTLHPEFRSIIDHITHHGCMTDFYTNGMHLDQELCDFLVERSVVQIIISFSGTTKETYENIYIGGNFEHVLAGIRRLAAAKKAHGSQYPVIHINSIGFEDHVARFDDFVEMMGEHGANVVLLSQLDVHPNMPHLFEHVSIMRPGREDEIIARAENVARRWGIRLNVDLYARHAAADEADYILKEASLRDAVHGILARQSRAFGGNPLSKFHEIAKALPMAREPSQGKVPVAVLALDAEQSAARSALQIAPVLADESSEAPFHCMEPFKTLYVTRNGPAKPCCFASATVFLGDVKTSDARDVWRGAGYTAVRDGMVRGNYPRFCSGCLKNKSAPRHSAGPLVDMYMSWHERKFGNGLRADLDRRAPDARRSIRQAQPAIIMAAAHRNADGTTPV